MKKAYIALALAIVLLIGMVAINNRDLVYAGLGDDIVTIDVSDETKSFTDTTADLEILKNKDKEKMAEIEFEEPEEELVFRKLELAEEEVELALLNKKIDEEYAKEELAHINYLRENYKNLEAEKLHYNLHDRISERDRVIEEQRRAEEQRQADEERAKKIKAQENVKTQEKQTQPIENNTNNRNYNHRNNGHHGGHNPNHRGHNSGCRR